MAKVSVLMNAYNAEKYLQEAIDSIYAQTFEDWEIIFIDNCSVDDTKKITDGYDDKIKYYKTDKNIPLGAARNFGLQHCHGDYIAFLDTDDIWLPNKLSTQVKIMEENKAFWLCYGGVIYINEHGEETARSLPKARSGDVFAQQLKRYEINMQSVLLKNTLTLKINEALRHSPDFDLFMHLASQYQVCVLKNYLVKYRRLKNSLTSKNIDVWWSEMKHTLDKLFDDHTLQERYKKERAYAYAKVSYYKACYLMRVDKENEASAELSKYKYLDYKYFVLYLLSLFPKNVWKFVHGSK
ncbi:MAG: hypothetical protein QG558_1121 [Campylobacterota bacterium]|nr:hypothetical protein [Campylobacterota bacterium]